ncbi:MAG: hypothetical protein DSY60_03350, partial [Persephonella sp.]
KKLKKIKDDIKTIHQNDNINISILDFIEIFELSIWRTGKEPIKYFKNSWINSFSNDSKLDLQGIISSFGQFIENYRCNYLVEDRNFKHIFTEYERLNHQNNHIWEILEKRKGNNRIEEEHIFAKDINDTAINNLEKYGFKNLDEYYDFIYIYGNRTFLEKRFNASIGNDDILNKASYYKNFCENNTDKTEIKDICKLGKELNEIAQYSNSQPNPAFKYYLEIRDLEIKIFAYKRFPPI